MWSVCCQLSAPNFNSNQAEEKAEFFRLKCSEGLQLGPHFNRCNLHLQPAAVSLSASRRHVQQEAQRRREGAVRKSSPLLTGPRLSMQFAAHRHMSITAVVGQHTTGPAIPSVSHIHAGLFLFVGTGWPSLSWFGGRIKQTQYAAALKPITPLDLEILFSEGFQQPPRRQRGYMQGPSSSISFRLFLLEGIIGRRKWTGTVNQPTMDRTRREIPLCSGLG